MGVQNIHDKDNFFNIWILFVQKPLNLFCLVFPCAMLLSIFNTSTVQLLSEHEDVGCAIPNVLIIFIHYSAIFRS